VLQGSGQMFGPPTALDLLAMRLTFVSLLQRELQYVCFISAHLAGSGRRIDQGSAVKVSSSGMTVEQDRRTVSCTGGSMRIVS